MRHVFYTPRFSYDDLETAVPTTRYTAPTIACGAVYGLGRVYGWVPGRAIPGYYPAVPHRARNPAADSEAGPGSPAGAGVGGQQLGGRVSQYPPSGPGRSLQALPGTGTRLHAASGPIRARFSVFLVKYSQNDEVSPKSVQKACHSPCFQKRVQKSALDFLRFPILVAFSHKELMGLF